MFTIDDIKAYKAPRWDSLPDIDLYMDQVLVVLEKYLSVFKRDKEEKIITAAMINNYVKQKITLPPVNKKYTRHHLAYLFTVCVLKNIMGLSDICTGIGMIMNGRHTAEAFNMFCESLDGALAQAFLGEPSKECKSATNEEKLLSAVTAAVANTLYCHYLVAEMQGKGTEAGDGK